MVKLANIGQENFLGIIVIGEKIDITLNQLTLCTKKTCTHPALVHIIQRHHDSAVN